MALLSVKEVQKAMRVFGWEQLSRKLQETPSAFNTEDLITLAKQSGLDQGDHAESDRMKLLELYTQAGKEGIASHARLLKEGVNPEACERVKAYYTKRGPEASRDTSLRC